MKKLLKKADLKIREEMKRVGYIDDSDNSDRFLDDLSQKLAIEKILKGSNEIELYYKKEHEIEQLQEKILQKIKNEIMNKYNRFHTNKNGYYEGCYYETSDALKAWKEEV